MFKKIIYGMWCAVAAVTCMCEEVKGMDGVVLPKWVSTYNSKLIFETVYVPKCFEKYANSPCVQEIEQNLREIRGAWDEKDWFRVESLASILISDGDLIECLIGLTKESVGCIHQIQAAVGVRLLELGIEKATSLGLGYLPFYKDVLGSYFSFNGQSVSGEMILYMHSGLCRSSSQLEAHISVGCVSDILEKFSVSKEK